MTDAEFVAILRLSDDVSKLYAADRIEALSCALKTLVLIVGATPDPKEKS